jgi:DNA-binding NtrC family response regulator
MTRPKTLLVEQPDTRSVIRRLLKHEGFDVISSTSIPDAMTKIVTQSFDVLITVPRITRTGDGLRLVASLSHLRPDALPIVILDSLDVNSALMAVRLPVRVVVRPFEIEQVAELLREKRPGPKFHDAASVVTGDRTLA